MLRTIIYPTLTLLGAFTAMGSNDSTPFDVLIRNGTVYDGSGGEGRRADVAIRGDRIAGVGDFKTRTRA
jgi:N-acyl-D-amino-acid deacylase